jgi:predicted RNA binding protein YcfA (HicA-like mRNA interferase family)
MRYSEMVQLLRGTGWEFLRRGKGTHELWRHPSGGTILVTRSGLRDRARKNWLTQLKRVPAA